MNRSIISAAINGVFAPAGTREASGPSSNLNPGRLDKQAEHAATQQAKAGFSGEAYGKGMAKAYLIAVGEATGTWQDGILFLLKSANDKQRAEAMTAATKVAADYDDETASSNLKKRISEARRVFKAADTKGTPDVIKLFEGKGSWHQKIAKLPKASTKGRKKNQGAGKTTKADQRTALVKVIGEEAVKALPKKTIDNVVSFVEKAQAKAAREAKADKVAVKHGKSDVAGAVDLIRAMSFDDARKVLDVCLFHLSQSPNVHVAVAAKAAMAAFDAADKANETKLERAQAG
jgi:hypothetical protein